MLNLGKEYHRRDNIGLVAGLLVQRGTVTIKDRGGNFAFFAANIGDIRGKAVEV
jgi:hypothetical protein